VAWFTLASDSGASVFLFGLFCDWVGGLGSEHGVSEHGVRVLEPVEHGVRVLEPVEHGVCEQGVRVLEGPMNGGQAWGQSSRANMLVTAFVGEFGTSCPEMVPGSCHDRDILAAHLKTHSCVPCSIPPDAQPMARWPRLAAPDVPMHITQRGNNRVATFADIADFAHYRALLQHASEREGCAIHAYALMSNHVHLLVTPPNETGVSRMMQLLGRMYVRYFNTRHRRSGTLWEGRFKSALVDTSAYFLTCSRYIDLNPVQAGIVEAPNAYAWSSYSCLGDSRPDPIVTQHAEYLALGRTAAERSRAYRALCGVEIESRTRAVIRRATLGGAALGSDEFNVRMTQTLQRRVTRLPHGGDRRHVSAIASVQLLETH
jgi:putative transposase